MPRYILLSTLTTEGRKTLKEKPYRIREVDEEIEKLQNDVAKKLGYKLVDHKLELYGSKIKKK